MKLQTLKSCLVLAACLGISTATLSCVETESNHYEGVHAFVVKTITNGDFYGTESEPLKYATKFATSSGKCDETCYTLQIAAYAVDINGKFIKDYNQTVTLTARPGLLNRQTVTFKNGVVGEWEYDSDGTPTKPISGSRLGLRYAYGSTRIWLEDTKQTPIKADVPCQNNKVSIDGHYCEPSLATGTSEEFIFEPQTIKMIQYNPDKPAGQSPLYANYAQLKALPGHDLVVTNVVSTGFYVTDLGDDNYSSLFIFTYSQPGRVEIGDRICEISGGVSEFTGMTQIQFPSWGIQNKERSTAEDIDPAPEDGDQGVGSCTDKLTGETRPCTDEELEAMAALVDCSDVYNDGVKLEGDAKKAFAYVEPPAPRILTSEILELSNVASLESLEASVVTVQDLRLSTDFINCDDNGNGKIETATSEAECRNECSNNSRTCTEISSLESYDQWRAWTIDGNSEISVSSTSLIADFNIIDDCYEWNDALSNRRMMRCPERHLHTLTGNLKQVLPTCSGDSECDPATFKNKNVIMTVLEPRFKSDLIWDTEFNKAQKELFDACINDKRDHGCLEACKEWGTRCTCEKFKNYAENSKTRPADWPKACPGGEQ